jgi:hypothetical protein
MSLPDDTRDRLKERMWGIADQINWLALGPAEKTQCYENWTKDPDVGGVLQRYMPLGHVRVYIKDSLLKDYPRERRADQRRPFQLLGLQSELPCSEAFIKPHGRRLSDGRVVCWGRAADWKTILIAVFERSFQADNARPFGAVLTEAGGRFSDEAARKMVEEVAIRLGIEAVAWDA